MSGENYLKFDYESQEVTLLLYFITVYAVFAHVFRLCNCAVTIVTLCR